MGQIIAVLLLLNIITSGSISDNDAQRLYQENSTEVNSCMEAMDLNDIP